MPEIVDGLKDPYGLNGGRVISGSATVNCDAFWYFPITATSASVFVSNLVGGSPINTTFTAGVGVYGKITSVSQLSGIAVVYSGSYMYPNQR